MEFCPREGENLTLSVARISSNLSNLKGTYLKGSSAGKVLLGKDKSYIPHSSTTGRSHFSVYTIT